MEEKKKEMTIVHPKEEVLCVFLQQVEVGQIEQSVSHYHKKNFLARILPRWTVRLSVMDQDCF